MLIRIPLASHKRRRAGTTIVAGLFVVGVVAVLCVAYLHMSLSKNREHKIGVDAKRALYIAEAGLSESFAGIVAGKSGNVGSDSVPARFADGVFWVVARDSGEGKLTLMSTGLCGSGRAALSIVVEKVNESVATLGVFAEEAVGIEPGCLIDCYDSSKGTYAEQLRAAGGQLPSDSRVGSNADVNVSGSESAHTTIKGEVRPGPDGTVTQGVGVTIDGSTAPREASVELPAVEIPAIVAQGALVHSNSLLPLTIAAGDRAYTALQVKNRSQVVIKGPANLVVDSLEVDPYSRLTIDGSAGPVKLYVRDYMNLAAGSVISTTSTLPKNTTLLVAASQTVDRNGDRTLDPPATFLSTGVFHGSVYAPNAALTVAATTEVFGAVCARSLTVQKGSKVHFDTNLMATPAEVTGVPQLSCWRVVDLPDSPLVKSGVDPLVALKLAGITPIPASQAHFDVGVSPPPSHDPDIVPYTGGLPNCEPDLAEPPAPPVVDAVATALLTDIANVAVTSDALKDDLLANSPVSTRVLMAAINRVPAMAPDDLARVCEDNYPLSDEVLCAYARVMLPQSCDYSNAEDPLEDHCPLSEPVLQEVLRYSAQMNRSDLRSLLIDSSPLPPSILTSIQAVRGILSLSDLLNILAAQ